MPGRLEFYFDFSCPFAYLGATQITALAARAGAELVWRPMLLGGVFRALGGPDRPYEAMASPKARHNLADMRRWADHFGVPLRMPAGHPNRTVRALRALLTLPEPTWPAYIEAVYQHYWVRGSDVSRPEVVTAALAEAGVTGAAAERALAANDDPAVRDELRRRTDEAIGRGIFGAPTVFVGDLMFWGQDRFAMVERALAGWHPNEARA